MDRTGGAASLVRYPAQRHSRRWAGATYLGRPPDPATSEDLRRFPTEQQNIRLPIPTMNSIVSALRFFFTHIPDRPDSARKLVRTAHPRKIPDVPTMEDVGQLLHTTACLKPFAALSVAYGAGLRRSEVGSQGKRHRQHENLQKILAREGPMSECTSRAPLKMSIALPTVHGYDEEVPMGSHDFGISSGVTPLVHKRDTDEQCERFARLWLPATAHDDERHRGDARPSLSAWP